jgi:hypothetical protein
MAQVPELEEYADKLHEAEGDWYRAYKTTLSKVASCEAQHFSHIANELQK